MRRDFLKTCALTGLGLSAPTKSLSAIDEQQELPPYDGPYYLVFNASGGWDTTYLMDPKGTDRINRLYTGEQIVSHGNH
ncbi:MAG: twin-arginine translocation signal domain-containing protein, partial [Planctomycetaceae bacterium]|nr:twin-arginine translocation signal domain-containing protein [Planctomycetaceae bacterium]